MVPGSRISTTMDLLLTNNGQEHLGIGLSSWIFLCIVERLSRGLILLMLQDWILLHWMLIIYGVALWCLVFSQ